MADVDAAPLAAVTPAPTSMAYMPLFFQKPWTDADVRVFDFTAGSPGGEQKPLPDFPIVVHVSNGFPMKGHRKQVRTRLAGNELLAFTELDTQAATAAAIFTMLMKVKIMPSGGTIYTADKNEVLQSNLKSFGDGSTSVSTSFALSHLSSSIYKVYPTTDPSISVVAILCPAIKDMLRIYQNAVFSQTPDSTDVLSVLKPFVRIMPLCSNLSTRQTLDITVTSKLVTPDTRKTSGTSQGELKDFRSKALAVLMLPLSTLEQGEESKEGNTETEPKTDDEESNPTPLQAQVAVLITKAEAQDIKNTVEHCNITTRASRLLSSVMRSKRTHKTLIGALSLAIASGVGATVVSNVVGWEEVQAKLTDLLTSRGTKLKMGRRNVEAATRTLIKDMEKLDSTKFPDDSAKASKLRSIMRKLEEDVTLALEEVAEANAATKAISKEAKTANLEIV